MRRSIIVFWWLAMYGLSTCDLVLAQVNNSVVVSGQDDSPLFRDTDPFSNSRAASFVATFLSGLSGSPMTACHVWRSITILTVCRETPNGPLSTSQMPISLALGDDPSTRYAAGAALLAPVLLWSVGVCTAVASLVLAKAKGASWKRSLIIGRYPQHLLFVFFYFYQTGVSSSTIVVVHDSDLTARILCGIALLVWVVMWLVPSVYLYYTVPRKAMYVKRFRDVSDEAEIEKELYRRLVQLEKENDEHDREADKLRMEAIQEEERLKRLEDHGADAGSNPESQEMANMSMASGGSGAGGTLHADGVIRYPGEPGTAEAAEGRIFSQPSFRTSILKSLQNLIPEGEEEALIRHTERYIEAAARADDANKERLRRATNLVYSKMLASQIQATAFDDSAVQQTLTGRDRWEDQKPGPGEDLMTPAEADEEDDVLSLEQQAALSVYVPAPIADYLATQGSRAAKMRSGFMNMWGGLFRGFKESSYWFIAVECAVSLVAGIVEGWRPVDAAGSSCYAPSSILVALYGAYFITIVVLRPYVVPLEMGLVALTSFLQLLAACFSIIAVVNAAQWASVGANVIAVCCIYLYVLKSLLDVFIVAAPVLYAQEVPWPTSKLTSYYFDTARKTSDVAIYEKKEQLRNELMRYDKHSTRRRSSPASKTDDGSSSTRSPRRSRAGSFSSAHSGGRDASPPGHATPSPPARKKTTPTKQADGTSASPQGDGEVASVKVPELNVRFVDSLEDEAKRYRMIGGRRNAYVTSRGVPEALHPFALCPLPPILHLPARDPNHLTRKQMKAKLASERNKALFTEVKLAEMFRNEFNEDSKDGGASSMGGDNNPLGGVPASATKSPKLAASTLHHNDGLSFLYEEQEREEGRQRLKRLRHAQRDLDREKLERLGNGPGDRRGGGASTIPSLRSDEVSSTNDSNSVSRRPAGAPGAAAAPQGTSAAQYGDDFLNLEDDPDVIMNTLLFSRGTFNVLEKRKSAAAPSGAASAAPPPSLTAASGALPQRLSNEPLPPAMPDHVKRELVGQRLLSMLRASNATTTASAAASDHTSNLGIPRRGSPPRQADPNAFRGSGVYAGTYSPNQREGGLRQSGYDDEALTTSAARQRRVRFTDYADIEL